MKLLLNYLSTIRVEQSWNEMQTFRTLERGLNQDKKKMLKASFLSGLQNWNNNFCVPPKGSGNENVLFATFRRGWSTMVVNQSELEFERRKRSTFSLPPVFIVAGR